MARLDKDIDSCGQLRLKLRKIEEEMIKLIDENESMLKLYLDG